MRRIGIVAVLSLLVTALAAVPALAQNPHFIGEPVARDVGTQLAVSGKIAGLGEEAINVVVRAEGTAIVECVNPAGNVAPGQDTQITAVGVSPDLVPSRQGQVTFENVLTEAPTVGPEACPNPQWTPVVVDVVFTSATIEVVSAETGEVLIPEQPLTIAP